MSDTPHGLTSEFPNHAGIIHTLRLEDAHFAKLNNQYHTVNREIQRAETNIEPTSDLHLEELKKHRLVCLDKIAKFLR